MSTESDVQKVKDIQAEFRSEFSLLKRTKDALLKLFRKKLEEKKIEEIQGSLNKK